MEVDAAVAVVPAPPKPRQGVTRPDPGDTGIQLTDLHSPGLVRQQQQVGLQAVLHEGQAQLEEHEASNR
jgi:hypothetical protein